MLWTLDRVVNFTEARLNTLIQTLREVDGENDSVRIYSKMVELGYVSEPSVPEDKTKEEIYRKRWGSYVGTINAYGIAILDKEAEIYKFTEMTKAYINGNISFEEFLTNQMVKWQLPNGGLTNSKRNEYQKQDILIKPFILVLQVMINLSNKNKLESWIDSYDINTYLLEAKDNRYDTIEGIVLSILNDRREQVDRSVTEFKSDVIFNSFCCTNFIHKISAPTYFPTNGVYVLNNVFLEKIINIIEGFKKPKFDYENDIEDKDRWLNYYGAHLDLDIETNTDDYEEEISVEYAGKPGINLIVYGAPGTGKSDKVNKEYGNRRNSVRVTFHPEYTYHDFVGSYRPEPLYKRNHEQQFFNEQNELFDKGEPYINYRFVPGPFTLILEAALYSLSSENPETYTLIIEEINRSNTPAVFGDLFQLLDRETNGESTYGVTNLEVLNYLKSRGVINTNQNEIKLPINLNLVATMNSADQGVFVMDSAFKRRWIFEYLPIIPEKAEHKDELVSYNRQKIKWADFVIECNDLLANNRISEDRHIGPYFLKPGEPSNEKKFSSKLLMYLWDDVGRVIHSKLFKEEIRTFSDLVKLYENGAPVFLTEFTTIEISSDNNTEKKEVRDSDRVAEERNVYNLTNQENTEVNE